MGATYENDIVAWANEQAYLPRSGKQSSINIEHIAEEIEDVGKSEQRELTIRMEVLISASSQVAMPTRTPKWKLATNH